MPACRAYCLGFRVLGFLRVHPQVDKVIAACRELGIRCIVAPFEADAQLAYLSRTNQIVRLSLAFIMFPSFDVLSIPCFDVFPLSRFVRVSSYRNLFFRSLHFTRFCFFVLLFSACFCLVVFMCLFSCAYIYSPNSAGFLVSTLVPIFTWKSCIRLHSRGKVAFGVPPSEQ